jgi:Ca-activated chloride channel family protein
MVTHGFRHAARIALFVHFCAIAFAFQHSSDGPAPSVQVRQSTPKDAAQTIMRVDSSLVLVPVHVTAASGASVTGLKKEDFVVFEDGVPQPITHFSQDDAPVSAGVLLDVSGSMKNKMAKASAAATAFFQCANPEDEFFLVEFNGSAKLKVPFTRDWSIISGEIARAKASGWTALLDGIHLAIQQMKLARNPRKALIVLSDGGDNFSSRSLRQLRTTLIESDVQVYVMGVFDENYSVKHTREERNGPRLLDEVALDTGGREFPVVNLTELPDIAAQLGRDLRNQYVLDV